MDFNQVVANLLRRWLTFGMEPGKIRETLQVANFVQEKKNRGNPEALLLTWVAWEGIKIRMMVVGLARQGWHGKTFQQAAQGKELWHSQTFNKSFKSIFGDNPANLKNFGANWNKIEKTRKTRNKFVHGFGQTSPKELRRQFDFLQGLFIDLSWLNSLNVMLPDGERTELGDIMHRTLAARNIQPDQSVERLHRQLGLK